MEQICPKCGHRFDDGAQAKAAKARWQKTSKADRSAAAKAAALARWKAKRAANVPSEPSALTDDGRRRL